MPLSTRPRTRAPARRLAPTLRLATSEPRSLRIGIVTEYYYPHLGGICEHVHYFAREARRLGHHVDIITSRIKGSHDEPNVFRIGRSQPVYFNGSQARMTLGVGLGRQMRETLSRGDYDVVHVHSPLSPSLPLLAIEAARCPLVGTFHTYFDGSRIYALGRSWLQKRMDRLDAVIGVSASARDAIAHYFDAEWRIIPNGIDLDAFNPGANRPRGLSADSPVILFLGRFDPRNGLITLIEAFRKVRESGRDAHLVVVGDGPLRSHYYRAAAGHPDISFVGAVLHERPGYYANAAVYACPTTKASFGITLLESMACETPVVCSDIPGFRDVVKHEREALMFPCGDADALASDLSRLLDDPALRTRLGKAGRESAERYGWSAVTAKILEVYAEVLERSRVAV